MRKKLIIFFIDALAFGVAKSIINDYESIYISKLLPAPGYSSNLHWLIFKGMGPNEVGFFTDFGRAEKLIGSVKRSSFRSGIERLIDKNLLFSMLYHSVLTRLGLRKNNIPLSESDYFIKKGRYLFDKDEGDSEIFSRRCYYIKYEKSNGKAFDKVRYYLTKKEYECGMVIYEGLDMIGHIYGKDSKEYVELAKKYIKLSLEIAQELVVKEDAQFIIISDHGMADVNCGIDIIRPLYKKFGLPGATYLLYADSVYLRAWSNSREIITNIKETLLNTGQITSISEEYRKVNKLDTPEFGQAIFVAKKGTVFCPNYFAQSARTFPAGMHGYLEDDDDNAGVLISNCDIGEYSRIHAHEVFDIFAK